MDSRTKKRLTGNGKKSPKKVLKVRIKKKTKSKSETSDPDQNDLQDLQQLPSQSSELDHAEDGAATCSSEDDASQFQADWSVFSSDDHDHSNNHKPTNSTNNPSQDLTASPRRAGRGQKARSSSLKQTTDEAHYTTPPLQVLLTNTTLLRDHEQTTQNSDAHHHRRASSSNSHVSDIKSLYSSLGDDDEDDDLSIFGEDAINQEEQQQQEEDMDQLQHPSTIALLESPYHVSSPHKQHHRIHSHHPSSTTALPTLSPLQQTPSRRGPIPRRNGGARRTVSADGLEELLLQAAKEKQRQNALRAKLQHDLEQDDNASRRSTRSTMSTRSKAKGADRLHSLLMSNSNNNNNSQHSRKSRYSLSDNDDSDNDEIHQQEESFFPQSTQHPTLTTTPIHPPHSPTKSKKKKKNRSKYAHNNTKLPVSPKKKKDGNTTSKAPSSQKKGRRDSLFGYEQCVKPDNLPQLSEKEKKQRIQLAYQWYNRLGGPTKDAFLRRVQVDNIAELTEQDIQLLPWSHGGTFLSLSQVMKMMV